MTISARHSSVAFLTHDAVYHAEFPHTFPAGDPGGGAGGASTITVQLADNSYACVWDSLLVDSNQYPFPPAWTYQGYRYPNIDPSIFNRIRPTGPYNPNGPMFKLISGNVGYGSQTEPNWASAVNIGDTVNEPSHDGQTTFVWERVTPMAYNAQPSPAQLQGAKRFWPHGFHHWGSVTWSKNFGLIASSQRGLTPEGKCCITNICYRYIPWGERKWHFMAPSSRQESNYPEYYNSANAWYGHVGYDLRLRRDLVHWDNNANGNILAFYVLNPGTTLPATRGAKAWQATDGDRAAGIRFNYFGAGGAKAIQIPWLSQWWVIQFNDTGTDRRIWGFSPNPSANWNIGNNTYGGGISTRNSFDIPIPADVLDRSSTAKGGRNISVCVDQFNQRVFAFQVDVDAAPVNVRGNRYPVLCWQIDPANPSNWTPVSFANVLRMGKITFSTGGVLNPIVWHGGSRFMAFDVIEGGSNAVYGPYLNADPAHATGNPPRSNIPGTEGAWGGQPSPFENQRAGGFAIAELYIPRANKPRTMTWTERTRPLASGWSPEWTRYKHSELTFNPDDGRVYLFGGDLPGVPGSPGSYSTTMISFFPETASGLRVDSLNGAQAMNPDIRGPIGVDENGFAYRAISQDFWMFTGYGPGHLPWPQNNWPTIAAWEAAGGTGFGIYRWNSATGWTHAVFPPGSPLSGMVNAYFDPAGVPNMVPFRWCQGEPELKRMYYDSGTDRMIAWAYGDSTLQMINCVPDSSGPNAGKFKITKYLAGAGCWNGPYGIGNGGDGKTLPDGRPYIDTVLGANAMVMTDRGGLDPATGWLYVANVHSGDLYRINTRTGFYNRIEDGLPTARTEWCCRMVPTGAGSNLQHYIWAKGALWYFQESGLGRLRVFSWAPGESQATEHVYPEIPLHAVGRSVGKYTVGGDERIIVMGNQADSTHPTYLANNDKYYTITLG